MNRQGLIVKAIGISLFALSDAVTETLVVENRLDRASHARVLRAVQSIDAADPFNARDALEVDRRCTAADLQANRLSAIEKVFEIPGFSRTWMSLSQSERDAVAQRCDEAYRRLQQAWGQPDAAEQVRSIVAEYDSDPWLSVFLSMWPRFRENVDRTIEERRQLIALLRG